MSNYLAKNDSMTIPDIAPASQLTDLHISAIKSVKGHVEITLHGTPLNPDSLETIGDIDYYRAFYALANTFISPKR